MDSIKALNLNKIIILVREKTRVKNSTKNHMYHDLTSALLGHVNLLKMDQLVSLTHLNDATHRGTPKHKYYKPKMDT